MLKTLEQLAEDFHPGGVPMTYFDIELAHIQLDPLQAKFHPALFNVEPAKIESGIDAIFIAATAGNLKAKFLILAAANNQVNSAGDEALAFGEPMVIPNEQLLSKVPNKSEVCPLDREAGIAMLDRSIAAIELAIEDASRSR